MLCLSGTAFPDVLRLYADNTFRKAVTRDVRNAVVREFWVSEFEKCPPRMRAESVMPIQNKLGAMLSDPMLVRILVTPAIDLRFRRVMDEGKILLANLSKGRIGENSAHVLGGLLVSMIGLATFTRAETASETPRPFFPYLYEFQNFTTPTLVNMMSELRNYGVGLRLAHQHLNQLDAAIRHAVLGNTGTLIGFRGGAEDAPYISRASCSRPSMCSI